MSSSLVNCEVAEEGLEFTPKMVADFESPGLNTDFPVAGFLYTYTDATATIAHYPGEDDPTVPPKGYEPNATQEDRCLSATARKNHVFHISGGPFLAWGGGMGISMQHLYHGNGNDRLPWCPDGTSDYCPIVTGDTTLDQAALDLSHWDGVALWARRGSNSQPLLRVLVGDKFTDDDISFLTYEKDPTLPRYCERVLDCACVGDIKCTYSSSPVTSGGNTFLQGDYCGVPGSIAATTQNGLGSTTNSCNLTRCKGAYPAFDSKPDPDNSSERIQCTVPDLANPMKTVPVPCQDPQFRDKACTPYALRDGTQSSFCFNPGDPPPAEPDQRCGDHFTFPLHLTTEWQLYLVPFSSMSQQGWAKKAPYFDLKSVSVVRLTWDAGNIDYFIDNISFYRLSRP